MTESAIRERLLEHCREVFSQPATRIEFTGDRAADELLSDLTRYPHAYVIACVMDRQIRAERAWLIPCRISQKLGSFDFRVLRGLALDEIRGLMTRPEPLHRFPNEMSKNLYEAIALIDTKYNGDASAIWANRPSSAALVSRFLDFRGVGPKIASMAANILVREFKVAVSDYHSIDISTDIHIRRVFERLGLVPPDASPEHITNRARELHPEFPGLMDLPTWEIGRAWCKPKTPLCGQCYMREVCPTAERIAESRA